MDLRLVQIAGRRWAVLAVAIALAVVSSAALGQTRPAPLPPARPSSVAPPAPRAAPPVARESAPTEAPLDPDHPPMLPSASRARVRECGREWEAIKLAGKDVDIGWRDFATECLKR